jgi:hypothetical protein
LPRRTYFFIAAATRHYAKAHPKLGPSNVDFAGSAC